MYMIRSPGTLISAGTPHHPAWWAWGGSIVVPWPVRAGGNAVGETKPPGGSRGRSSSDQDTFCTYARRGCTSSTSAAPPRVRWLKPPQSRTDQPAQPSPTYRLGDESHGKERDTVLCRPLLLYPPRLEIYSRQDVERTAKSRAHWARRSWYWGRLLWRLLVRAIVNVLGFLETNRHHARCALGGTLTSSQGRRQLLLDGSDARSVK